MRTSVKLIATHAGAMALGWALTDKGPVDTEAHHEGFFTLDTTKILSTTVESLRAESKLLVFSYKGSAKVQADRRWLWVFSGHQELIVPAAVSYFVDLSDLTLADVSFNEKAKIVTVRLPRVTLGEIAFQPEAATTINGGLLTYNEETVEALRKLNYSKARRAMTAQAQQPGLLNAARRQARDDVTRMFEIPLRIAGQPEVKVVTVFK